MNKDKNEYSTPNMGQEKKKFEQSLKLTKISFLLSGILINKSSQRFQVAMNCWYISNFICQYVDISAEIYWFYKGVQSKKSFSEISFVIPCIMIVVFTTTKAMPMFINRHLLVEVVDKLRKIHPDDDFGESYNVITTDDDIENITIVISNANEPDEAVKTSNEEEKKIINDSNKMLNNVIMLLFCTCSVVVVMFSLMPLMSMAYDYRHKGSTELKLPFMVDYYFFKPYSNTWWPYVYLHLVWSTFISSFNIFGTDTLLYACCSYLKMHFDLLGWRCERFTVGGKTHARRRLSCLARRHQVLIDLVNDVEILYSKSMLFNMVIISALICMSAFNVTYLKDKGVVFAFLTMLLMNLSQISLLCFFGDMLMHSSTQVADYIYNSNWYEMDQPVKKIVMLMIIRAQKPCKLTAAKFADVNLLALNTILSRSWSYFALLNKVQVD